MGMREELAKYAHETWSGWLKYMFSQCTRLTSDGVTIPAELVSRWMRQMDTAYADLPESEKKSDREEADKILKLLYEAMK